MNYIRFKTEKLLVFYLQMIYRTTLEIRNHHTLFPEFSPSETANGNNDLMPETGRLLYPHAP